MMLFEEETYFNYKFPEPQYLGAKHTHLGWIKKFIPKDTNIAIDAFAGSQSVAFLLKQMGIKTITNDFLNFNHQIGVGLIENNSDILDKYDIEILFHPSSYKKDFSLIEDTFTNIFFERGESEFLDNFRANIPLLLTSNKQALAYTIINRSMTRKVTMGHFGHTQALKYASDPERVKRNRSLIRPIKDIFKELLPKYNNAVFDNHQENKSYNENILDLLPKIENVDLAYFDPPYCDSHADYQSFYHLLETFTEYWKDKKFINGIRRYEPQRFSGFDKKRDVIASFERLFEYAQEIPHWLISYNNRSYPSIEDLAKIISKYRQVSIEVKTYHSGRGGKGSVAGSQEVLFVCQPIDKYFINLKQEIQFTMKDFNYWKKLHESENLGEFSSDKIGLLWLKTKSIIRKELLAEFILKNKLNIKETALNKQFMELFRLLSENPVDSHNLLDKYIRQKSQTQIDNIHTEQLVSELYKLKNFDWGGDYQNSLDKYLVSRYVKVHKSYDTLISKFETEINVAVQGYVLNSWYNHWSSILIENIFKSHNSVLPTVGQIKSVDFFINDIPFDLKVTYLPAEYLKSKRKEKGLPVELTFLKRKAEEAGISFDKKAKDADICYEIVEKMKDRNDDFCLSVLATLKNEKLQILVEAQSDPKILATWLYENQGEMRFGSENRLFLVLVDTDDFGMSWKLKRNLDILKPTIIEYLDNFKNKKTDELKIEFDYKGKSFTTLADIIFVVK